jgi:hypothetical protein
MDDIQNIVEHYVNQLSSGDFEDAWQSLVELGPSALPYVVRAFAQSGDDKVSILLIRVVNEYRTSEALSFLANLLKSDRPEMWKTALDGFVAIADEDASATLHETAKALSADKQAWITEASDQIGKRRRILSELMRNWEQRFPDLAGEWTHWWRATEDCSRSRRATTYSERFGSSETIINASQQCTRTARELIPTACRFDRWPVLRLPIVSTTQSYRDEVPRFSRCLHSWPSLGPPSLENQTSLTSRPGT